MSSTGMAQWPLRSSWIDPSMMRYPEDHHDRAQTLAGLDFFFAAYTWPAADVATSGDGGLALAGSDEIVSGDVVAPGAGGLALSGPSGPILNHDVWRPINGGVLVGGTSGAIASTSLVHPKFLVILQDIIDTIAAISINNENYFTWRGGARLAKELPADITCESQLWPVALVVPLTDQVAKRTAAGAQPTVERTLEVAIFAAHHDGAQRSQARQVEQAAELASDVLVALLSLIHI